MSRWADRTPRSLSNSWVVGVPSAVTPPVIRSRSPSLASLTSLEAAGREREVHGDLRVPPAHGRGKLLVDLGDVGYPEAAHGRQGVRFREVLFRNYGRVRSAAIPTSGVRSGPSAILDFEVARSSQFAHHAGLVGEIRRPGSSKIMLGDTGSFFSDLIAQLDTFPGTPAGQLFSQVPDRHPLLSTILFRLPHVPVGSVRARCAAAHLPRHQMHTSGAESPQCCAETGVLVEDASPRRLQLLGALGKTAGPTSPGGRRRSSSIRRSSHS